jgi:hypothetical protein
MSQTEYDRAKHAAGLGAMEFPDEAAKAKVDLNRIDAAHADFRARMAELNSAGKVEAERAKQRREAEARATIEWNNRCIIDEYAANQLQPVYGPGDVPVSLSLMKNIQEYIGQHQSARDSYRDEGS